jgi:hypothetical protein
MQELHLLFSSLLFLVLILVQSFFSLLRENLFDCTLCDNDTGPFFQRATAAAQSDVDNSLLGNHGHKAERQKDGIERAAFQLDLFRERHTVPGCVWVTAPQHPMPFWERKDGLIFSNGSNIETAYRQVH